MSASKKANLNNLDGRTLIFTRIAYCMYLSRLLRCGIEHPCLEDTEKTQVTYADLGSVQKD